MRRMDTTLANRVITEYQNLSQLYLDLRKFGDPEAAGAVRRAMHELEHPSMTASLNQVGVNSSVIRA